MITPSSSSRTVAYLRVSTTDQDVEKNKSAILALANDRHFGRVEFIEECISGKISWKKRAIANILEDLKSGDRIIGLCRKKNPDEL